MDILTINSRLWRCLRMSRISTDEIAVVIMQELHNYTDETIKDIKKATRRVARWAKAEVREKSPKKTGEYSKGWSFRTKVKDDYIGITIHQKKKPTLTYLLEHGHLLSDHKRKIRAIPHIEKVQERTTERLDNEIFKIFE